MIIRSKTTLSYVGDMNIQRDNVVEARRPDIMLLNKKKKRKNVKKKKWTLLQQETVGYMKVKWKKSKRKKRKKTGFEKRN